MLEVNPTNRPSAEEIQEANWFSKPPLHEEEYNRVLSLARTSANAFIESKKKTESPYDNNVVSRGAQDQDHPDNSERESLPVTYDPID